MTFGRLWVAQLGCMVGILSFCGVTEAQDAAAPATPAPAQVAPAATAAPAPTTTQTQQGASDAPPASTCVPSCRAGYLCSQGQCVSRCNPACDPGQVCTDTGTCVAQPTAAQAPVYVAPPLDARDERALRREELREQRAERRRVALERRAAERARQQKLLDEEGYHGRFYAGPHITAQGRGSGRDKFSTHVQLGLDLGYEVRNSLHFGLGPALRVQRISYHDLVISDLMFRPTLHVPFGIMEFIMPFSVGLAMGWDGLDGNGDGPFATDSVGMALDFMPGFTIWPTRGFGLYANVGLATHIMYVHEFTSFYTTAISTGINISH